MSGIKLMKNAGVGTGERIVIMNDPVGGHLKLFPGSNQVVLTSQLSVGEGTWKMYKSTDSGDTYEEMDSYFPRITSTNKAVSFNNRYYFIGDPSTLGDGKEYMTSSGDYGATFTYDPSSTGTSWFSSVSASRDGKYVLATSGGWGVNGDIISSQDFGETWDIKLSTGQWFRTFVDETGMNQIVGNYSSQVYYSDDYGSNFSSFPEPLTSFGGAMVSGDGNYKVVWEGYESGSGSRVYVSTDWVTWDVSAHLSVRLNGGAISNDGKYMAIVSSDGYNSPEKYVNLSSDYGVTWTQKALSPGDQHWSKASMSSDGKNMIAIGGPDTATQNRNYRSVDYGVTWEEITEAPAGQYYDSAMSRSGRYAYIVGRFEGIIHSKDYTASWTQQNDGSTGGGVFINF